MDKILVARAEIAINAPVQKVWEALTDPEIIKKYFFGTHVVTDWQVGSPIIWKGTWKENEYEDRGTVLRNVPFKLLETTYWSSMSGLPDSPENYKKVTYELSENNGNTKLIITQDNNKNDEEKTHSEQNWNMVLDGLKKLMEE